MKMKRKLFFILLLCGMLNAHNLLLGIGSYIQTQPYRNDNTFVAPSLVAFYDNALFYARWTRFGVYLYGYKANKEVGDNTSWAVSLTVQPRVFHFKPSNNYINTKKEFSDQNVTSTKGLKERKGSLEGGIAFSVVQNQLFFEFLIVTDLLRNHNAYIASLESGMTYNFGDWTIVPDIAVYYESKRFMRYYYGVSQEEALQTDYSIYRPSGGMRFAAQTYINYKFSKKWSAFFNLRIDRLSSKAINSPIVDKRYMFSTLASVLYTF